MKTFEELLPDWFAAMALKYCGKDFGSTRLNRYHFYRTVYKMPALEAWRESADETRSEA